MQFCETCTNTLQNHFRQCFGHLIQCCVCNRSTLRLQLLHAALAFTPRCVDVYSVAFGSLLLREFAIAPNARH